MTKPTMKSAATAHASRALVAGCAAAVAMAALAFAYALLAGEPAATAAPAVNLQVLPKDMDKQEVKRIMKKMGKALGVKCKFCHDTDDMSKDTEHKEVARKMMRMVDKINAQHLAKMKIKDKVTCQTCHRGKEHPAK